ncbi:MAG: alpha/beta hydrolase family protein [Gemmataceae bacterium]
MSDQSDLSFSLDGEHLYYSVSSPARPTPATSTEQPLVELWHYKDDFIPTMQKVRYNARPTFRAVFHLSDSVSRQISDENLTQAQPMSKGDWVVGFDDRPYRILVGSREAANLGDTYLINGRTGERRLIDRKQPSPPSASPEGKYLMQFDGKDWISISIPEGKRVNLTSKLGVPFAQEWYDQPSPAPAHGLAGWMDQDRHVLLYDRYDIWMIAADGSSTKNITGGHGRKTSTQYRIVRLDPEERSFNPNKALLLQAENETTRDTGFCHATVAGGVPRKLIMGPRSHGTPVKATRSDRLLLTVQSFHEFPDLYSADSQFRDLQRVSDANPQKAEYHWGKAELLRYKNSDGLPLDAILIKPDNFDPKLKYPMIVYIYERLSQNIHRFVPPSPGTNINPSYYASNGYLVLMPDIAYTIGHPGQSCVKCVLPAIQAVADRGFLDENAVGIQGHSWGGYQTAYLITQTTRFKAAAAGALVGNMTSAYGGIRLGTGLPRQFQYERTQSRIGGTLWELPSRFLENSPIFHADRIKTPLLMLHNDRDDAVPWQQGIEFFLALRRLGKEVYMFNYPGELHGLRQRVNQKDYTVRLQEFFDHHLKGAPRPDWMAKGIPYAPPPGENPAPAGGGRRGRTTGSTPTAPQEPE